MNKYKNYTFTQKGFSMYFKRIFLTLFLASSFSLAENSIGLDINNDDLELLGSIDMNALTGYADGTQYLLTVDYLHADDNLLSVGLIGQNTLQGIPNLTLGLGAKTVFTDNYAALPLLAKGIFRLPLNDTIPPTSLSATFAYAPKVLSFRDAKSYQEFRLEADMEVINNIHLFTGYRNIDTDYEAYNKNFNDSFYGGLKLSF
jgi:hypothetical protein